jgi:hypothetical protein
LKLVADRDRTVKDSGAKRSHLFIQSTWLGKIAVKRPIHGNALLAAKSKHPEEPILHSASVELLHDMDDLSADSICGKRVHGQGKSFERNEAEPHQPH